MRLQRVHFLVGYVADGKQVRARCTCGFLTTPHVAQRPARVALVRGHGLSTPVCELCGRGDAVSTAKQLPEGLTILTEAGREIVVCAAGSGGCAPRPVAEKSGSDAGTAPRSPAGSYHRAQVHLQRNELIERAHRALTRRHQIPAAQAVAMLEQLAHYYAISVVEAARRVVAGSVNPSES